MSETRERILKAFDPETGGPAHDATEFLPGAGHFSFHSRKARLDYIRATIMAGPSKRALWSGLAKAFGGAPQRMSADERDAVMTHVVDEKGRPALKSLTAGTSPGSLWLSEAVARDIFDICPLYGAYKTLRVIKLAQGRTKFVKVTGLPTAYWLIPNVSQGTAPSSDTSLSGAAVSQECNTLLINIEASEELLQDEKVDWGLALLEKLARGLAQALDFASFAAGGAANMIDGGQIGIFAHPSVPVVTAAAGQFGSLTHEDFLLAVAAIRPAGLQHGGRFWVNPVFLPKLLLMKDGNLFLCQTPAQNPSGEYTLCGFPLSLTTAAPSVDANGKLVAAFGWGDAYTIGMRLDAEIMTGAPKWNQALKTIRAATRARCDMGDAGMFSILKLAGG